MVKSFSDSKNYLFAYCPDKFKRILDLDRISIDDLVNAL